MYVCIYIHIHIYMCVYIYIYIYAQRFYYFYSHKCKQMDDELCYSLEFGYIQVKHKTLNNYHSKFSIYDLYYHPLLGKGMLKYLKALVAMIKQWFCYILFSFKNSMGFTFEINKFTNLYFTNRLNLE